MSSVSFKGKVVLVTGAGSVIGSEIARHFSKLGAVLVLTDTDKSQLNKVNEDCGGNCLVIAAELTKNDDVLSVFNQTVEKFKRLDVLVNYARTEETCEGNKHSSEYLDQTMHVNVHVVYHVTTLAAPLLFKTKGNVVNVLGLSPGSKFPQILSNSVSRSALEQLTKCVALQLSSEGVRVNSVSPDMIDTLTNASEIKSNGIIKQNGSPKDVADAVAFLASDRAAFISGVNLPVDGGRHLTSNAGDFSGSKLEVDTRTKSVVHPPVKKAEVPKEEANKEKPAPKQASNLAPVQKSEGREEQPKRELKDDHTKSTSTKLGNHDKSTTKHGH